MAKHRGGIAAGAGAGAAADKNAIAKDLISKLELQVSSGDIFEPDWLIKIDKLTSGDVKGYEGYCHVYAHKFDLSRNIEGTSTGFANPSGSMQSTPLLVVVPSSAIKGGVGGSMTTNTNIVEVELVRLAEIAGKKEVIQQIILKNCLIKIMTNESDETGLAIVYGEVVQSHTLFDQDGKKKGKDAFGHSFNSSNVAKA